MRKRLSVVAMVILAMMLMVPTLVVANSNVIYDNSQEPLPPNVQSLGYEATSTDELGDHIVFAGTDRLLSDVTVTMSTWALQSTYPEMLNPSGWEHPITLNIYDADMSGDYPDVGELLATVVESFLIPWRPEADPTCPGGTTWRATDGQCYNGLAFNIAFDLSSLNLTLPDEIIYGIAFNTRTHGATPLLQPGPYESLNVGLNTVDPAPSVGTDVEPDAAFWDTSHGPFYSDGGIDGTDTFRRDTGWTAFAPAVQFNAISPQPTSKDDCKDGRWEEFGFTNQGQCIKFVNTGK